MLVGMGISTLFGTASNIVLVLDASSSLLMLAAIVVLMMLGKAKLVKEEKVMLV